MVCSQGTNTSLDRCVPHCFGKIMQQGSQGNTGTYCTSSPTLRVVNGDTLSSYRSARFVRFPTIDELSCRKGLASLSRLV